MKMKEAAAIIVKILKDGPKTMKELSELTGFTTKRVYDYVRCAKVDGLVEAVPTGKETLYWDKAQWEHTNEKKQDRGPITRRELNRIRRYIRPGFRVKVCCYTPRRGEDDRTIRTKHIKHVFRHVVTFKEGGSTTLIHLAQYFRENPGDRCIQ